jgi:hypothetical protein
MKHVALLTCVVFLAPPALAAPDLSEVIVDVKEDQQPVREVLRRLQLQHGLNYVVSEQVLAQAGTVTVQLSQVPLDDALAAICAACGLELSFRGSILVMLPSGGRPLLPKADVGLLPRGASRDGPIKPVGRDAFLSSKRARTPVAKTPVATGPAGDGQSSMMVGTVGEVDMEKGRLQLKADGVKRDFYLAAGEEGEHSIRYDKLRRAFSTMKPGHRVALLYTREGNRSVVTNLIGGDKVRESQIPTNGDRRRRRARGPAPLRAGPPAASPGAKPVPAKPRRVLPEGVLAGRFVSNENGVVKIKRADGKVIECVLPTDDKPARDKLEKVIASLKVDSQVFMTYKADSAGKLVIRGGISEVK